MLYTRYAGYVSLQVRTSRVHLSLENERTKHGGDFKKKTNRKN